MDKFDPAAIVNDTTFFDNLPEWRRQRMREFFDGGIFISHSSADVPDFRDPGRSHSVVTRISAAAFDRVGEGVFFYNRKSGGPELYMEIVNTALSLCDKFLLLVSEESARSSWVRAEVEFALTHQRHIIEVHLDGTNARELYDLVPGNLVLSHNAQRYSIRFEPDPERALKDLGELLDQLMAQIPYRGLKGPLPNSINPSLSS